MSRPKKPERNAQMLACRLGRMSVEDVAREFCVSPSLVSKVTGPVLGLGGRRIRAMAKSTIRNLAIGEKYKAGKTTNELAEEYGLSRQRIQQILIRLDIPRRRWKYE